MRLFFCYFIFAEFLFPHMSKAIHVCELSCAYLISYHKRRHFRPVENFVLFDLPLKSQKLVFNPFQTKLMHDTHVSIGRN